MSHSRTPPSDAGPRQGGRFTQTLASAMQRFAVFLMLLFFASHAEANGGGPLLLIFNVIAFAVGSVAIIAIEAAIYCAIGKLGAWQAIKDAFWVNLFSTLVIGFGLPIVVSLLSVLAGFIYEPLADFSMAIGTWVFEGIKYPEASVAFVYVWLIVAYFLTVYFESSLLANRWKKSGQQSKISAKRINWIANTVTYFLLALSFTLVFAVKM